MKLVRLLYKKYCVRKGIRYVEQNFVNVAQLVGRLALQCLHSGCYFFERDEVLKTIGDEAFEYGFISGHEDFRLLDGTADVLISFPHRTIEEFFGAFSLVLTVNDGIDIESITRAEQFYSNFYDKSSTFLEFCLFAISHLLECKKQTNVKEMMIKFVLERIDRPQLDMTRIFTLYPALGWTYAAVTNNKVITKFLEEVFSKCSRVKYLLFNTGDIVFRVIDAIGPLFAGLHCVHLTRPFDRSHGDISFPELCPCSLNFVISDQNNRIVNEVMSHLAKLHQDIWLFVNLMGNEKESELSVFLDPIVCGLHLACYHYNNCKVISAPLIRRYDRFTHISVKGLHITKSCLLALSEANKAGRLPSLSHISFLNCQFLDDDNIKSLLQSPWINLTNFSTNSCFLSNRDIRTLSKHKILLPLLTSLELYLGGEYRSGDGKVIRYLTSYNRVEHGNDVTIYPLLSKNLHHLWLHDIGTNSLVDITKSINRNTLPNLTELGMSTWMGMDIMRDPIFIDLLVEFSEKEMMNNILRWMARLDLPVLQSLEIHRFIRSMEMLYMFSRTPILTQLHKLDISHSSGVTGVLSILLCHSFPSLSTLILSDCGLNSCDLSSLTHANNRGRLPKLKHLDVSQNKDLEADYESFFSFTAKSDKLSHLVIDRVGKVSNIFDQKRDARVNLSEVKFNISGASARRSIYQCTSG